MSTLYEDNVRGMLEEKRRRLEELVLEAKRLEEEVTQPNKEMEERSDSIDLLNRLKYQIYELEQEIHVLEMLYENYSFSTGAFRRTKGARKVR